MKSSCIALKTNRFANNLPSVLRLTLGAVVALGASFFSARPAHAGVIISWALAEGNFQGSVSGSFSAAELAQAGSNFPASLSATAFIDTTPTFASYPAGTHLRYNFLASTVAFTPNFIRLNSYSGTSRSGDVFGFYKVANDSLSVTLPAGYQADSPINATLTVPAYGNSLSTAFTMGEVVKVNGNALITFAAVPEPASLGLTATGGLAALCWTMLCRRKQG